MYAAPAAPKLTRKPVACLCVVVLLPACAICRSDCFCLHMQTVGLKAIKVDMITIKQFQTAMWLFKLKLIMLMGLLSRQRMHSGKDWTSLHKSRLSGFSLKCLCRALSLSARLFEEKKMWDTSNQGCIVWTFAKMQWFTFLSTIGVVLHQNFGEW